ncbi:hypothetical protein T10_8531 [Trichinella papuae]|uniref:Uncharacterized protein n=1 Tax=Trichinella papuae TaxID=268474 RepID=A0A0V1N1L7_9BILA|nr:hypothetical protein T10_8531 [Trichinella papuae]
MHVPSVETRVEQTSGSIVLEKEETRAHVTATPVRDRKKGERPKIHWLCSIEWHLTDGHGGSKRDKEEEEKNKRKEEEKEKKEKDNKWPDQKNTSISSYLPCVRENLW